MKAKDNKEDNFQDPGEGFESHLFKSVLQHIRSEQELDPAVAEAISENLVQDQYFGKYYLKIRELEQQGLFDDSYTYAQFLMECENTREETDLATKEEPVRDNQRFLRREPWRNMAAAVLVVIITALITYQVATGSGDIGNDIALRDNPEGVTTLGGESSATNAISFTLDEEIRHNSELQSAYEDPVFCKMHLVFKGITKDETGFIVRSKRRGIGDEDPFREELEVRFSDSGKKEEITQSLIASLKNREFPEFIVRGLYEYGEDADGKLPLLIVYELKPVE